MLKLDFRTIFLPILGAAVLLAAWALYVARFDVPVAVLPSPAAVFKVAVAQWRMLLDQGIVTLLECIYGFVLAFVVGVPLAVAVASSRTLNGMFYPLLIAMQSVPKVALAPIVLVWLGIGIESKLAIVFLVAFFPIVVDTAAGLRLTPRDLLELAQSLKASRLQIFCKIQFPAALPFIMAGSKVAITLSVIGAVIGEFIGSNEGLGNLLLVANSQIDTPLAFAALFALAILGMLLYGAVALVELALSPWLGHAAQKH